MTISHKNIPLKTKNTSEWIDHMLTVPETVDLYIRDTYKRLLFDVETVTLTVYNNSDKVFTCYQKKWFDQYDCIVPVETVKKAVIDSSFLEIGTTITLKLSGDKKLSTGDVEKLDKENPVIITFPTDNGQYFSMGEKWTIESIDVKESLIVIDNHYEEI